MMEAGTHDVEFTDGKFTIAGTDRSVGIVEVAEQAFDSAHLPSDLETLLGAGQFRPARMRDIPQRGALLRG